jgi:hypothetical protein
MLCLKNNFIKYLNVSSNVKSLLLLKLPHQGFKELWSYMTLTVTVAQLLQNLHACLNLWNHNAKFGQGPVHLRDH